MADIDVHEKLDNIDYVTVGLYRVSFAFMAIAIATLPFGHTHLWVSKLLLFSALLSACCMHIYNKTIRWFLLGSALFAIGWHLVDIWPLLAIGASLVTICGLAIKEYYCFRLKVIRITPLVLIAFWCSFALNLIIISQVLAITSGLLLMGIFYAKCRQAWDFDIGDKSKFEI